MKYKRYVLTFGGDPEIVAFLKKHIPEQHDSLAHARNLGRCAEALFGVKYRVTSVTVPRPTAERVKSL